MSLSRFPSSLSSTLGIPSSFRPLTLLSSLSPTSSSSLSFPPSSSLSSSPSHDTPFPTCASSPIFRSKVSKYDQSRPWVSSADPLSHIHRIQFHPNQSLFAQNKNNNSQTNKSNIINSNSSNNSIISPTMTTSSISPSNTIPSLFWSTSPSQSFLPLSTFSSWERDYQISRTQLLEYHHGFWSRNNSKYESLKSKWIHSCKVVFEWIGEGVVGDLSPRITQTHSRSPCSSEMNDFYSLYLTQSWANSKSSYNVSWWKASWLMLIPAWKYEFARGLVFCERKLGISERMKNSFFCTTSPSSISSKINPSTTSTTTTTTTTASPFFNTRELS